MLQLPTMTIMLATMTITTMDCEEELVEHCSWAYRVPEAIAIARQLPFRYFLQLLWPECHCPWRFSSAFQHLPGKSRMLCTGSASWLIFFQQQTFAGRKPRSAE